MKKIFEKYYSNRYIYYLYEINNKIFYTKFEKNILELLMNELNTAIAIKFNNEMLNSFNKKDVQFKWQKE